jgi:hypothetical protein
MAESEPEKVEKVKARVTIDAQPDGEMVTVEYADGMVVRLSSSGDGRLLRAVLGLD